MIITITVIINMNVIGFLFYMNDYIKTNYYYCIFLHIDVNRALTRVAPPAAAAKGGKKK